MFKDGPVEGIIVQSLSKFTDQRGWLSELFRHDQVPEDYHPVMGYTSMTRPGIARGPHEHVNQADLFCFIGPSTFKVYLWDNRKSSPTYGNKMTLLAGEDDPKSLIIPPGVVHAYKNVGSGSGIVLNFANQLYAGWGKKEPVDEIRHEDKADSPFRLD